jgi:hypothetical protein
MQIWDLWYPHAGAQGISFARGRLDDTECLLIHAAPPVLRVEVRDEAGNVVARADDLERSAYSPVTKLQREASGITRTDSWPDQSYLGLPIMLPGGEVAILTSWWHSEAQDEWRWNVEFYNHR